MKVEQVRIQKFRSIDDATVHFDQVLAIVGANNVGKSHILRALNAFFNFESEIDGFERQDHVFSSKSRPKITVTFSEITDSDGIPTDYLDNGKLTVRFTYRWDRKVPNYEVIVAGKPQSINMESFKKLIEGFRYIYVPIIRNSDATFSSENGIAYTLLSAIVRQQIAKRNTLQPLVNQLYQKIEGTIFKTAVQQIKRFYPFAEPSNFQFQISNNDLIDAIIHDVTLELVESSQHNSIENCGSGVQSAVYYAIRLATTMDSDISYMIGIEEPELNMHPQAQRELIESFKDISKYPSSQFVITTHSTVIIDHLGHQSVALCRKCKGPTRDIITTIAQTGNDFWDKYQITEERYSNFFEYKNSDFFFSNYVIITESPIDSGIISHLLERSHINVAELGITFIPANGEKNIKYPYSIVKELKIPFFCVVDRDVFQPYTAKNRRESIDDSGLPCYKPELKLSSPICGMLSPSDQDLLLNHFINNKYEQASDILDKYSIVSMRYAVEMDLIACPSFCHSFCDVLNITGEERTAWFLAVNRSDKIKKYEVIRSVLAMHSTRNLPASYKRIIKKTRMMIKETDD